KLGDYITIVSDNGGANVAYSATFNGEEDIYYVRISRNAWNLIMTADFNGNGKPDYALYNFSTQGTAIWYLNNNVYVSAAYGPILPSGWQFVATGDFNHDGKPDYVLYKASTRQTAIWYLNNNVYRGGAYGPTLPARWILTGTGDCNGDNKPDYVLYNSGTHQTAIWYLNKCLYRRWFWADPSQRLGTGWCSGF